jgi:hypothetical protein
MRHTKKSTHGSSNATSERRRKVEFGKPLEDQPTAGYSMSGSWPVGKTAGAVRPFIPVKPIKTGKGRIPF